MIVINLRAMNSRKNYPKCPDFQKAVKEAAVDESLFDQIVGCYASRLSDFANFYCRDDNLGQDAFQDAMIAALTNLDGYRGDAPIEPWLRRIVATSCSRLRRGRKNSPAYNIPIEKDDNSVSFKDSEPDQELKLMMYQGLARIKSEIDNLDEPNRTLLFAHDVKEEPIADLAKRFDLSVNSIKSRLKRSRAQVRERITQPT